MDGKLVQTSVLTESPSSQAASTPAHTPDAVRLQGRGTYKRRCEKRWECYFAKKASLMRWQVNGKLSLMRKP